MTEGKGFYQKPTGISQGYPDTKQFYIGDLSIEERKNLYKIYGSRIEDVLLPIASQNWFFSQQEIVSPDFYIQSLYKVHGFIEPKRFTAQIEKMIAQTAILRTNFYRAENRILRILMKERTAMVLYHTLEHLHGAELDQTLDNIMEADRRRGFDLAREHLVRIAVFRTAIQEYAILITQPQVIADGWDVRLLFEKFFADVQPGENIELPATKKISFEQYLHLRREQDKEPAVRYWKKLLQDLPPMPAVPEYRKSYQPYQQEASILRIDGNLAEQINVEAKGDKPYLVALLQTAWGLMLQQYNKSSDTYFCTILSNRKARLENMEQTSTLLNVMPIRVDCQQEYTVKELLKKQVLQVIVSQPFSYCDKSEIKRIVGRKEEVFDHFLNFHGFFVNSKLYSETKSVAGVVPVFVNSFDARGLDLGVYFRHDSRSFSVEFVYNKMCFEENRIEALKKRYFYSVQQLMANLTATVQQLKEILMEKTVHTEELTQKISVNEKREFIHSIELFSNLGTEWLDRLARESEIQYYLANDFILHEGKEQENVFLIMYGKVSRSRTSENGWMSRLDILGERKLINEYSLLTEDSSLLCAKAMSEEVVVLVLPKKLIKELIEQESDVGYQLIQHLLHELNKYQKLWINAG